MVTSHNSGTVRHFAVSSSTQAALQPNGGLDDIILQIPRPHTHTHTTTHHTHTHTHTTPHTTQHTHTHTHTPHTHPLALLPVISPSHRSLPTQQTQHTITRGVGRIRTQIPTTERCHRPALANLTHRSAA